MVRGNRSEYFWFLEKVLKNENEGRNLKSTVSEDCNYIPRHEWIFCVYFWMRDLYCSVQALPVCPVQKICSSTCCSTWLVLWRNPSRLLDLGDVAVFLIRKFFPRLESCCICLRVFLSRHVSVIFLIIPIISAIAKVGSFRRTFFQEASGSNVHSEVK